MVLSMIESAYERWLKSEDGKEKQAFIQELREEFPADDVHSRARIKALESTFLRCAQELDKRTDELNYYRRRYNNALEIIAHLQGVITGEVEE